MRKMETNFTTQTWIKGNNTRGKSIASFVERYPDNVRNLMLHKYFTPDEERIIKQLLDPPKVRQSSLMNLFPK